MPAAARGSGGFEPVDRAALDVVVARPDVRHNRAVPSLSYAAWSGWITAVVMVAAGLVQLWHRLARGRRAGLGTNTVSVHVVLGLAAAGLGFLHPLTALLSLGSPGAIGGGALALGLGALAFVLLLAHSGLGLKLRDPTLRKRPSVRARHVITAALLVGATAAHALACIWGAE